LSEKIKDKNNKNGKPGETKKPQNGAFVLILFCQLFSRFSVV
jgi:hypothetical protein